MQALGRHVLIELWQCNSRINDADSVREAIVKAVDAIGATILNLHVHAFEPQGVTGLALLAESHFSIHTWPEHGYLAADVFTCQTNAHSDDAVAVLRQVFQPESVEVRELERGVNPDSHQPTRVQVNRRELGHVAHSALEPCDESTVFESNR